jgi:hypothetical protein
MLNTLLTGRFCALAFSFAALCTCSPAQDVPGRLLVKFRNGATHGRALDVLARSGARELKRIDEIGFHVLELPTRANVLQTTRLLRESGEVLFAEPDEVVRGAQSAIPNDPWYANWQPQLRQINCPGAWFYTTGDSRVLLR